MKRNLFYYSFGSLLALVQIATSPFAAFSEDKIDLDAIRKEIQEAKASTGALPPSKEPASGDAFSMKSGDLEKRRAALLAAEKALLSELSTPDVSVKSTAPLKVGVLESEVQVPHEDVLAQSSNERIEPDSDMIKVSAPEVPLFKEEERTAPQVVQRAAPSNMGDLATIKAATSAIESNLASLRKTNVALEGQLKSAKGRSASLQKELEEAKDRLMIAEAEVERLSGLMKTRSQQTLTSLGATPTVQTQARIANPAPVAAVKRVEQPKIADDVLIGTVIAEKANLRTGPGKDNSPFMTVGRGSRLTVETRNGDWYRVITPTGTRAWVASEVLAFGDTNHSGPSGAVRIRGFDSSLENETVQLISNHAQ